MGNQAGLRLGATALSLEGVLEGLELEDGSVFLDYSKLVRKTVENGFKHVELSADLYYVLPASFSSKNLDEWVSMREEGITFSAHLPIWSIELDSPVEDIRAASVSAVIKPVTVLEDLKPLAYVLHVAGPLAAEVNRMRINPGYKQLFFETLALNASKSIGQIVSYLADAGVKPRRIALESIEFPFSKTLEIAERFDTSICIDTGHILAGYSGEISVENALRKCSSRLGEIHLHDAYRRVENGRLVVRDHLPLGAGDLNVEGFFKALRETGFTGPIVFELGLRDARASLSKIASHL
ncbi:MAG: sugar phosphate isomerase/epimerase [Thaumarchaeota archaeon]|jgi:sugar phosphate isomerase/epimerase|nr:sugar phosphate isomerase/epimerase [Nitrososphaerota archaeon]